MNKYRPTPKKLTSPWKSSVTSLDMPAAQAKAKPPLPQGAYLCEVGEPSFGRDRRGIDTVTFPLFPIQPTDDVDIDIASIDVDEYEIPTKMFWLDDGTKNLIDFIQRGRPDIEINTGITIREAIQEFVGSRIFCRFRHKVRGENRDRVFNEVVSIAASEFT